MNIQSRYRTANQFLFPTGVERHARYIFESPAAGRIGRISFYRGGAEHSISEPTSESEYTPRVWTQTARPPVKVNRSTCLDQPCMQPTRSSCGSSWWSAGFDSAALFSQVVRGRRWRHFPFFSCVLQPRFFSSCQRDRSIAPWPRLVALLRNISCPKPKSAVSASCFNSVAVAHNPRPPPVAGPHLAWTKSSLSSGAFAAKQIPVTSVFLSSMARLVGPAVLAEALPPQLIFTFSTRH